MGLVLVGVFYEIVKDIMTESLVMCCMSLQNHYNIYMYLSIWFQTCIV